MRSEPLAFRNGQFLPLAELTIPVHDAGFVFGATVTDFCRTYRHQLFRWPDHLARFRHDCQSCRIPLPYTDAELTAAAERLVQHAVGSLPATEDVALISFATPGPLGYLVGDSANGPPTVGMHALALPRSRYRRFFTEGVTLQVAGPHPGGLLPVAVKHRSRLHWWLAQGMVDAAAVPVLIDPDGVPDTPLGGLLAVVGDTLIRPRSGAVLESVSFQVVRDLCGPLGLTFAEGPLDLRNLGGVSELLLAGSGFGLAAVRRVLGEPGYEFPGLGPVGRKLLQAWSQVVGVDVEQQILAE